MTDAARVGVTDRLRPFVVVRDGMRVAVGDTDGRGEGVRDGVSATVIERDPSTVRVPAGLAVALLEVAVAVRGGGVETVPVGDVV